MSSVHRSGQLFAGGELRLYLEERRQGMMVALRRMNSDALLATPTPDVVAVLIDSYAPKPLELHVDRMEQLPTEETQVDVAHTRPYIIPGEPTGRRFVPGSTVSVAIPFEGDPDLFSMRGSMYFDPGPQGRIRDSELIIVCTGTNLTAERVKAIVENQLDLILRCVKTINQDLAQFTNQLYQLAHASVEQRKANLLRDRGLEGALGIPMRRRQGVSATPVPIARKRLGLQRLMDRSQPAYQDEYTLDRAHYEEAIAIIQGMGRMLERSPITFRKLSEEELRDHILLQLNGTFEGQGGAELFNGDGKTDILVRIMDRNVFIAECKFWSGAKAFGAAIDQLLGYLVWRDTKGALILFIRQRDVTAIINKAEATILEHPNFKRRGLASSDTQLRRNFILHQTGDPNREISLALLPMIIRQGG